jgi:hypothetical protein
VARRRAEGEDVVNFFEWMSEAERVRRALVRERQECLFRVRLIDATLAYNPLEERIVAPRKR